jgi:hypothetical protein
VSYFHELDAWTEYWDVYHPESSGRYYFGDGRTESGLLTRFLPRGQRPPAFRAWTRAALYDGYRDQFHREIRRPEVEEAVLEIDDLVGSIFAKHFGDPREVTVRSDYLSAMHRFAIDDLPPAAERASRIAEDDPRKATAGRHTLDGDLMWFAWALALEAAQTLRGSDLGDSRRALQLAGVASACPANFAWRGHRRTRAEYQATPETLALLKSRGLEWARDFAGAAAEVRELFRIREWGESPK